MFKVCKCYEMADASWLEQDDFEDECGPIVTLRKGWTFDPQCDNRVLGEDSAKTLLRSLKQAKPFAGPYDE